MKNSEFSERLEEANNARLLAEACGTPEAKELAARKQRELAEVERQELETPGESA